MPQETARAQSCAAPITRTVPAGRQRHGGAFPETFDFSELPQVIRVTAPDRSALASLARRAGICFQDDAPFAILSCLPPCDPPTRRQPQSEFPSGKDWTVREFDPTALRWQPADRRRAQTARTGLFQLYISFQPALFFLRWHGATYKVPRSVAVYVLLRRTRPPVVRYDAVARAEPAGRLPAAPFAGTRTGALLRLSTFLRTRDKSPDVLRGSTGHRATRHRPPSPKAHMNNPLALFRNLRNLYLRYLDSPFDLRYRALVDERRRLARP